MAANEQQQVQEATTQQSQGQQAYHMIPRAEGYRPAVIRESRIKDRPQSKSVKDDSLSIKIQLDLEVEVCIHS